MALWLIFQVGPARRQKRPDGPAPDLALQRIEEGVGAQGIGHGGTARHHGRGGSGGACRHARPPRRGRRHSPPVEPPRTVEEAAQHLGHCGDEMGWRRGATATAGEEGCRRRLVGRRRDHRLARPELQPWAPVQIEIGKESMSRVMRLEVGGNEEQGGAAGVGVGGWEN
jgi:hypothetical protein